MVCICHKTWTHDVNIHSFIVISYHVMSCHVFISLLYTCFLERAPSFQDFDNLVEIIKNTDPSAAIVFNCQV